jgi:hypothetical protein
MFVNPLSNRTSACASVAVLQVSMSPMQTIRVSYFTCSSATGTTAPTVRSLSRGLPRRVRVKWMGSPRTLEAWQATPVLSSGEFVINSPTSAYS